MLPVAAGAPATVELFSQKLFDFRFNILQTNWKYLALRTKYSEEII